MVKDGLLKRADQIIPYFYHLKIHPRAYSEQNYKHEYIAGNIYVVLDNLLGDNLAEWSIKEDKFLIQFKIRPDRSSIINTQIIFWEIDRSTMTTAEIAEKIEKYLEAARNAPLKFYVVFACTGRRMKSILKLLQVVMSRKVWFYVVDYKELIDNPASAVFYSSVSGNVTLLYPVSGA